MLPKKPTADPMAARRTSSTAVTTADPALDAKPQETQQDTPIAEQASEFFAVVTEETAVPALPNLGGVATQNLVQSIGTGKYAADYINWSRTLDLLRNHAPGWMVDAVTADDGSLVHRAPVGGYLLIRFRHIDGRVTVAVPQAVMDNRNAAIPYEKITARDVTDTHRRGACLAAAMLFGLGFELWAKLPLESGYGDAAEGAASGAAPSAARPSSGTAAATVTRETFLEAALAKGLNTYAAEELANKLNGNFAGGLARLAEKDQQWVNDFNKSCAPKPPEAQDGSQW